jgi:PAS domain-containing protein
VSILDDIYDAVGDDQALARLPAALAGDVGARSCVIQLFSQDGCLVDLRFNYFTAENVDLYIERELYKFDTWMEIGRRPDLRGTAFNCDDFLSLEEFLRSPCYNEIFRSWGDDTARLIGGCFSIEDHTLTVGLHRGVGDKRFEAGQLCRLQNITGHLRRLYVARQVLGRANARASQLAAALDAPLIGIIRVDLRGRLVHANSAGHDVLRLRDGFALVGQTVAVQAGALQQRFAEAVRTAALRSGGQGDALLVPRPSGEPPWRVVVTPDEAQACGRATLLIESSRAKAACELAWLEQEHGLPAHQLPYVSTPWSSMCRAAEPTIWMNISSPRAVWVTIIAAKKPVRNRR